MAEIIGNDPFDEQVLEVFRDARKRLIKSDARVLPRMLPTGIQVYALPITVPATQYAKFRFTPRTLARWQTWYGFDFHALQTQGERSGARTSFRSDQVRRWAHVAPPLLLTEVDFARFQATQVDVCHTLQIKESGLFNGVAIYFTLTLDETTALSLHPAEADNNNWRVPVWMLDEPLHVQPGEVFDLTYRYRVGDAAITCRRHVG